jgi:hypothetical protein
LRFSTESKNANTPHQRTLMVNPISCPALCVFAPLREALPGLYHQSPKGEREGTWFPHIPVGDTF